MKCPKKLVYASIIFLTLSLSAFALDVELLTTNLQSNSGEPVGLIVRVTDNSSPLNHTLVNFTTTLGMLNSSSAYTNSSGIAEVQLNSTVAGTAQVNASSGSSYDLTNVAFLPLTANYILIDVDHPVNSVGNITNITLTPVDILNNINSSELIDVDISITDYSKSLVLNHVFSLNPDNVTLLELYRDELGLNWTISEIPVTPASGRSFLSINSTFAGNITIVSNAGSASNSTELLVLPGEPSKIKAVYNEYYTVNSTSSMYVRIYDMYDNPVPDVNLTLTVTSPVSTVYNSPVEYNSASLAYYSGITDFSGQFANVFRTDKRAGANTINIAVDNTSLQGSINITGTADEINNLLLARTPYLALSNNKDFYTLSARPVDQFLNPILPLTTPIKELVRFTTASGNLVLVPLNSLGQANTIVGPTPYVESLSITTTYRNDSGYTSFTNSTTLYFAEGPLYAMDIYSVPNAVLAQGLNGNHEATVSLVALDEWGHTLPGISVTLNNTNTTTGTLTVTGINATDLFNVTTDSNGRVQASFVGNVSGNTTILATSGNINASTNISVKSEPFMSVTVEVEPSNVVSGGIVNVTTVISIEGELPIIRPAASAMLVLDRSGSMDPDYYAGTPLDVVLVIDRSGSMAGQPIVDARDAAKEFVGNLVSNSKVGIVSFATTSTVNRQMTSLNVYNNKLLINNAIDSLVANGYTAMGDGMANANNLLINNGRSGTRKVMIVLTDGETNTGSDPEDSIAVANANGITIYTIGLGDVDESLLGYIASETGGKYYYAPDSSELREVYNAIAQELSDYDISEVEYGEEGFTPYDFTFSGSISGGSSFQDTFEINETLDDIKVKLSWTNSASDLYLQLTTPSGRIYGAGHNTTGYYPSDISEYVWIEPLSGLYSTDVEDNVETGTWTVRVTGNAVGSEPFTVSTYIDKKSAAKLSSHAFISSFDESRGDKAGLALYSYEDIVQTNTQTSYILDNSTWVGYFTVPTKAMYNFEISLDDSSAIDAYLYDGIDLLNSSSGTTVCEVSYLLSPGKTYHLDIVKGAGSLTDTQFNVEVSTSPLDTIMTAYYDSSGGGGTPKFRTWDSSEWSTEQSAKYIGGRPYHIVLEPGSLRSEIIMGTADDSYDVNVQVWDGLSWSSVTQFTSNLDSYERRGFDIKYEQNSGDAIIAYMDTNINDRVSRYRVWDGSSWSSDAEVDDTITGSGDIGWVRLEANPNSDEMVLVTLDDKNDMCAQVWDGNSWGHVVSLTTNAATASYQCFDVAYEQGTGRAIVVWADKGTGYIRYRIWNGNSWSLASNLYSPDETVCWVKMAADPNSNKILLAALDDASDIRVTAWSGSSWLSPQEIETNVYDYYRRSVDLAFEQSSGTGIVVWGDSSSTPKYRTLDGSSWSSEHSARGLGGSSYTRWVQLTPDPISDDIFLMTSDGNDDLNIQKWDGSSWSTTSEVETSSTRNYECYDLVFSNMESSVQDNPVSWSEWTARVTSTLENNSISHLSNAIDTITADGLTAIDEGLVVANNELSDVTGNSTIVIMTDGIDNAGYHSLLEEAYRARDNNTTIYTVGFGNSESEVDPVLEEIAAITGGEYYFAPNSSVLEDIFKGIAMQITNFSAGGPELNIHVPYNYVSPMSVAKVTYIPGSSNATTGNLTLFNKPVAPGRGNAEPIITASGNKRILEWQLPTLGPGDKWGVWHQIKVEGAGYVPLIMPTSTVTYTDLSGENITIYIPTAGGTPIGGGAAGVLSYSLGDLTVVPDMPVLRIGESTKVTLTLKDITGNSSFGYVRVYSSLGSFSNYDNHTNVNPITITVIGSDHLNFTSQVAGKAYITAYATNFNDPSDMLNESELIIVRPKGMITIT